MALMTIQPPLPFAAVANSRPIGQAVEMTEDEDGGQVFIYGILNYVSVFESPQTNRTTPMASVDRLKSSEKS